MTDMAMAPGGRPRDLAAFTHPAAYGMQAMEFLVEGIHCGGCVARIERELGRRPEVTSARVNLTTRRLVVEWRGESSAANGIALAVEALGFSVSPFDAERAKTGSASAQREFLRCLAVAGFGFANVMLLSVSIWAGGEMGPATHALLQWFSAAIGLPTIVYAGMPFFRSAISALAHRRANMDVPISIGVVLTTGMSLFETLRNGPHIYFDSALALLFFLLVGRFLDRRVRGQAYAAAERLLALGGASVTVLDGQGRQIVLAPANVVAGMRILVAPGERVAVDGRLVSGRSDFDTSLITGETTPSSARVGQQVYAGTLNLSGAIEMVATAVGADTLLAEIARLMEAAQQKRSRYVALADRLARLYGPAVHILALFTFLGWWLWAGAAWQTALMTAVTVLIITCPCALALAVPVVQIVASGRLFRAGILLKNATALERLAEIDTIVFDKTGTLTLGRPKLVTRDVALDDLRLAASMAAASRHPLARALLGACPDVGTAANVVERPGEGLSMPGRGGEIRLGSRWFCGADHMAASSGPEIWLARPGRPPVRFAFADDLRPDAAEVVSTLRRRGYQIELLSGDHETAVTVAANALGLNAWRARATPADKHARLAALAVEGRRVLMVGDGLNDAPALAAAYVSLSPATAPDISQTAADAIFQGAKLRPVVDILDVARRSQRLVRSNFALSLGYNALFVPLAIAGLVTPLIAAVAMSSSSILVTLNALTLRRAR
jgi:Cu2+-exporting ATPase